MFEGVLDNGCLLTVMKSQHRLLIKLVKKTSLLWEISIFFIKIGLVLDGSKNGTFEIIWKENSEHFEFSLGG